MNLSSHSWTLGLSRPSWHRLGWRLSLFAVGVSNLLACLLVFAYLGVHHWVNAPVPDELPFHDSLTVGDLRAWNGFGMQQLCCSYSAQVVDAPTLLGGRSIKFVLNRSDPAVKGSHRAELRLHAAEWGHDYSYAIRIYVPSDWVADPVPVTVVQWHNVPDLWRGEWGLPSALNIDIRGDDWFVGDQWGIGPRWLDPTRDIHSATLWQGPLERGRWTNWIFHVKWSYGDDGMVEVWKEGRLIAQRAGPNAYADDMAPYFKFGLYVPAWTVFPDRPTATDKREIWFSGIEEKLLR